MIVLDANILVRAVLGRSLEKTDTLVHASRDNLEAMNVNLTPDQEAFIREGIAAGRFHSPEDALQEALMLARQLVDQPKEKLQYRAQPGLKLALLKRQTFTVDGRAGRVAASLAALNATQPTDLALAQWKEILEEIEDED
ncbi:MAG TPA: hypothetical protein VNW97_09540 [Candidatus Saccharimonadales bacterium]|jgi:Arc/MetJ-type ribon-helix-helix transcriptional regulator|nr:hypothetical protein [Candidatus Saccharimonadales bacterium]